MHYLRYEENLSFTRRKIVNFIAEIYIFPFIECLLLLFNVFYHRNDREIPTAAAFAAVLNMSSSGHRTEAVGRRTEAVVNVVRRRSLRFSYDSD